MSPSCHSAFGVIMRTASLGDVVRTHSYLLPQSCPGTSAAAARNAAPRRRPSPHFPTGKHPRNTGRREAAGQFAAIAGRMRCRRGASLGQGPRRWLPTPFCRSRWAGYPRLCIVLRRCLPQTSVRPEPVAAFTRRPAREAAKLRAITTPKTPTASISLWCRSDRAHPEPPARRPW